MVGVSLLVTAISNDSISRELNLVILSKEAKEILLMVGEELNMIA